MAICKGAGLDHGDIEDMTIGFCLDFVDEYVELNKPEDKKAPREASQKDFDNF